MPITKVLKTDRVTVRFMLHVQQMTSAQQNALESAKDKATFRNGLVEGGKENLKAVAARRAVMEYPN